MFNTNIDILYGNLVKGLSLFFHNQGKERAVLGLSGGIDSAVVMAIAAEALGKENVHGILMPSPFSTVHSVTDAVELAANLGVKHSIVPIEAIYNRYMKELDQLFNGDVKGITSENLQARIRGNILMAYSNNSGALLLNTSNKSELAMGYGTLYGDLCGAIMVLGDVYKLQAYNIAHYINCRGKIIPESTITKEPSAELRDNQKDSDSLPEYSILDPILHALLEEGKKPEELIENGAERIIVERIVRLNKNSEFKAAQIPPVIQVTDFPLLPKNKCIKYI
ncbi:MAG: NAD(+) synthase [Bacteroidales bacterium]|nr:NAD(+) synthase [Bacteroidales bacterium]MDD4656924.1 NAD(+) synthase [Bacteroidales bacterium]